MVGLYLVGVLPQFDVAPAVDVILLCDVDLVGITLLSNDAVLVLSTGKELVVEIESLSAEVDNIVGPRKLAAYKLLVLINECFKSLTH